MAATTIQSELIGSCRYRAIPPSANPPITASPTPHTLFIVKPPPVAPKRPSDISADVRLWPPHPSGEQALQCAAIARHDRIPPIVAATDNNLHARAPDGIDYSAAAGEDPGVENLVVAAFEECRVIRCQT